LHTRARAFWRRASHCCQTRRTALAAPCQLRPLRQPGRGLRLVDPQQSCRTAAVKRGVNTAHCYLMD
jgi:hypothetical protein